MPYTKRKTMKLKSFENWLTARGLEPKVNKISEASNDGNEMLKNNLNDIIDPLNFLALLSPHQN